jgi:N-acetylneuraminic acid mutarotase
MPEPRLAGAAVTLGDFIYVIGGTGGSNALLRYDPARNQWTSLAGLSQSREHTAAAGGFAAVAVDGKLYALGGEVLTGANQALTSVEVFDPRQNTWGSGPDLPLPLHGVPAVSVDGVIYILGGADRAGAISNQGLVFSQTP